MMSFRAAARLRGFGIRARFMHQQEAAATAAAPHITGAKCDEHSVSVCWSDGVTTRFHHLWLQDSCMSGFDPSTRQRMRDTYRLARDSAAGHVEWTADWLRIHWTPKGSTSAPLGRTQPAYPVGSTTDPVLRSDPDVSEFDASWLRDHAYETRAQRRVQPKLWRSDLMKGPSGEFAFPRFDFAKFLDPSATEFDKWLTQLRDYGLALIDGAPTDPATVARVAGRLSYVRRTHYGETFQVRSELDPSHLAYTPVGLQFHTDLNYRESSPGIQLLHCLQASSEGGESTFLDGFRVAEDLRQREPRLFDALVRYPIPFQVIDEKAYHYHKAPTVCADEEGNLVKVHFNDRTRAPLELPADVVGLVYEALAAFSDLVNDPANHVEFTLRPGQVVAFNNRRILHGRKPFSNSAVTVRHLEGCYVDYDEFLSALRRRRIPRHAYAWVQPPPLATGRE
eukprot:CAMPEP_0196782996 /NCGR_PEP_ID=MMETSP1104-20130614/12283_1 /TAXON_ID=33652 /ORGANISM="Cafeteria sp., Strain Caron Lab Isolate" /LENGTH=450 /DNA_ID=CAMNT_0042153245 /DNA_START=31 /DNA_END=1383 /DNA_ORIENTATION=+